MLFGKIDFPEPLWESALAGNLVVFAGAGVSMGKGASLPSFDVLCDKIAEDLPPELQRRRRGRVPDESADEYLGRIADTVPVHERARKVLRDLAPKPTLLHRALIALFPSHEHCRIATTNFDTLFEDAAAERWGRNQATAFEAPALPVGSDFTGIVHLHGSLWQDPKRLVLTDRDFSRAYLTEGWARRFVRAMAGATQATGSGTKTCSVLFVGFSFLDVPSRYLLRGLPADARNQLFALIPANAASQVPSTITPIPYDSRRQHRELTAGLAAFSRTVARDESDHLRAFEDLLAQASELEPDKADYLAWGLQQELYARQITISRSSQTKALLDWVARRDLLQPLFVQGRLSKADLTPAQQALAVWFARLAFEPATWRACIHVLGQAGGNAHPQLRAAIGWELRVPASAPSEPQSPNLQRARRFWLAAITAVPQRSDPSAQPTSDFLDRQASPETAEFLHLWAQLANPFLEVKESFLYGMDIPDEEDTVPAQCEVDCPGDHYALTHAWLRVSGLAATIAPHLLPLLQSQIEKAHLIRKMISEDGSRWDPESFQRTTVRQSSQNRASTHHAFFVVVDAARDCITALLDQSNARGRPFLETWLQSMAPLVRRIAMHAYARVAALEADDTLDRIVDDRWLDTYGSKPEVFEVLHRAYPAASPIARRRLLDRWRRPPPALDEVTDEDERVRQLKSYDYEWFNVLTWLTRVAPDDPVLQERLLEVKEHNPEFAVREQQDLDHWVSGPGPVVAKPPMTSDELQRMSSAEIVVSWSHLSSRRVDDDFTDFRAGFLDLLASTASQSPEWAINVSSHLVKEASPADLVEALLRGLATKNLPVQDAIGVVAWLAAEPEITRYTDQATQTIDALLDGVATELDDAQTDATIDLCARLWNAAPVASGDSPPDDHWLQRAINRAQGRVAMATLHVCSAWKKRVAPATPPFPNNLRELLTAFMDGDPITRPFGRVVVASQLHFFFAADERFTRDKVIPWFHWSRVGPHAVQAWDGYLFWGHTYPSLFEALLPALRETLEHLDELGSARTRLAELYAAAAIQPQSESIPTFLADYFQYANDEDRGRWMEVVADSVARWAPADVTDLWCSWLRQWVAKRCSASAFPPLAVPELTASYHLAVHLPPTALHEALILLQPHPAPSQPYPDGLFTLERRVAELPADDILLLLVQLLHNYQGHLHLPDDLVARLAAVLPTSQPASRRRELRRALLRLNCTHVADLLVPLSA